MGLIEIVKYLIEQKQVEINSQDPDWTGTPIFKACSGGNIEILKYLHSKEANVLITERNGFNCMHAAARGGNLECIKFLIEKCKVSNQINKKNNYGTYPIHHACENPNLEVLKVLFENGANVRALTFQKRSCAWFACFRDRLETVKYLKSVGVDLKQMSDDGFGCVYLAAKNKNLELMKYLIDNGCEAQLNKANKGGGLPIHVASEKNHFEMVRYLVLGRGCDLTKVDDSERSSFWFACGNGNIEIANFLFENGCEKQKNQPSKSGTTPLQTATEHGHLKVVKYLVEEIGCDPNVRDKQGNTALMIAMETKRLDIVKYLISIGCDDFKNVKNQRQQTPFWRACSSGNLELVKYLNSIGEISLEPDQNGITPLKISMQNGHFGIARYLVSIGIRLFNEKDDVYKAAFFKVCEEGNLEGVSYFVEIGFPVNETDGFGRTGFYKSCSKGKLKIVKYLIEKARCNRKLGTKQFSPFAIAKFNGHEDVVQFLKSTKNKEKENVNLLLKEEFDKTKIELQLTQEKLKKAMNELDALKQKEKKKKYTNKS